MSNKTIQRCFEFIVACFSSCYMGEAFTFASIGPN